MRIDIMYKVPKGMALLIFKDYPEHNGANFFV